MANKNKKLNILFVIRSINHFPYFKSIISSLFEQGHEVFCFFDKRWSEEFSLEPLEWFKKDFPNFVYGWARRRKGRSRIILNLIRELLCYGRYLKIKNQSTFYAERQRGFFPRLLQPLLKMSVVKTLIKNSLFISFLQLLQRKIPPYPTVLSHIKELNPDVVLASPTNMKFLSAEPEYLRAAASLGLPTALPVYSWDNLTTKNLILVKPDLLLAWNEEQVNEAQEHHEIPPEKIRIMGAPLFDDWFKPGLKPSCTKTEFCRKFGLREDLPIVTYISTTHNLAKDEDWLVVAARKALDESDESLVRQVQLIVRPHPAHYKIYEGINMKNLFFIPLRGARPDTYDNFQLFYDTLYHSSAVVLGVNTSAVINAIIMQKPVIAILTEKYKNTQSETQHFRQLIKNDVMELSNGIGEFPKTLKKILNGIDDRKEKRQFFVQKYLRPRGLEISAGEAAVLEIEKLAERNTNKKAL